MVYDWAKVIQSLRTIQVAEILKDYSDFGEQLDEDVLRSEFL